MKLVNCGHPAGCQCEDSPIKRVPCGINVAVTCKAAMKVWVDKGGNPPINGAWTHTLADLFSQLQEDGYVLAKLVPTNEGEKPMSDETAYPEEDKPVIDPNPSADPVSTPGVPRPPHEEEAPETPTEDED